MVQERTVRIDRAAEILSEIRTKLDT